MKWLLLFLIIITVIILIPPIRYGYIYPTAGDDTATHLLYFTHMNDEVEEYYMGTPPIPEYPLYFGQYMVGWILNRLPFDITKSFFWLNYSTLIVGVWTIGIVVAVKVNHFAGVLVALLVFGRSYLLTQFNWGVIFDIVGVAVMLPLLLLCLSNIRESRKWQIATVTLLPIFAVFHDNGKYLMALIPIVLGLEVILRLLRKHPRWVVLLGNRFIVYCVCLSLAMIVAYFLNISIDPARIFLDASVLILIIVACVAAILVEKRWKYQLALVVLALVVSYPQVSYWLQDNSALKTADEEAICYMNGLEYGTYSVSPEITKQIYYLYTNKPIVKNDSDYLLVRSVAMTETSAIAVKHSDGEMSLDGYRLLKTFDYGEVERYDQKPIVVSLYGKVD